MLFCPNKGKQGKERALLSRQVGEQLAHVITQERDDHEGATDPYCAPNGIYIPCLRVITPRTLHFLSLLTYADPTSKVRPCTKARKSFFVSLCRWVRMSLSVCFPLLNSPKIAEDIRPRITRQRRVKKKKKKKSIKINRVLPHSFSDKQQLHRMGNKYYLCDRKTIRHC